MKSILGRAERLIGMVVLAFVAIGCFVVLRPFVTSLLLAAILSFATWPAFQYLERRSGLPHGLAAFLMSVVVAVALIGPFLFVGTSAADDAGRFIEEVMVRGLPPPPLWIAAIPVLGDWISDYWLGLSQSGSGIREAAEPYLDQLRTFALSSGLSVGRGILELTLSLIVLFFFYRDGIAAAGRMTALNRRIFAQRADHLQQVVAGTIRSVIYGVLGTALAQGAVATAGFSLAGLPAPLFLGFITFLLALLPIGPPLIWIPAVFWLFTQGTYPTAIFMALYGFFVISGIDNILKPYLISKGSDLPLLVVFLGLFGGIAAFGFLGIFLGPTLLALGFALIRELSMDEISINRETVVAARIDPD